MDIFLEIIVALLFECRISKETKTNNSINRYILKPLKFESLRM